MNTAKTFVVGVCTRLRDSSAFIDVRAQSIDGILHDCSQTSQRDFPPDGEVELRSARTILKMDDWALARPLLEGPPRRQRFVSTWMRRLTQFDDLSDLYAPEAARRLLVETGLQDGFVGEKIFRISSSEMVVVNMVRSDDGRCRANAPDLGRLPTLRFDPAKLHSVPKPSGSVSLFERGPEAVETGFVNWLADADYVALIVRAAAQQDSEEARSQAAVAALVLSKADQLRRQLSGAQELDPKIAQEILRSRRLGELLTVNTDVVCQFMTALRRDPEVAQRSDQEVERLSATAVAERRAALTAELTRVLETEFAKLRQVRSAELETFYRELDSSMMRELDEKIQTKESEALSNLEVRRLELERAVSSLELARDELNEQRTNRVHDVEAFGAEARRLSSEIVEQKADIDRLLQIQQVIENTGSKSSSATTPAALRLPHMSESAKSITIEEIAVWIKDCPFLSDAGRAQFSRLTTLVLSGAAPVISGPDSDDVVAVMAALLSGGALVEFECDPTVLTLDDLWTRPGSNVHTILGAACAEARGGQLQLCTIRRPEITPSQYWVGALRRALKNGYLPQKLLLCIAVTDEQATGAEALLNEWPAVRAEGWIDRTAAMRTLSLKGPEAIDRRVDTDGLVPDAAAATTAIALAQGTRVTMGEAKWIARLAAAAKAVLPEDTDSFLKETIERALNSAAKPELKVIDGRGPAHA
jgi:hypothetical protein